MTKQPTKRSGLSKPSNTEGETKQPFEAAAQIPLAAAARSKRPKAEPDQVTSVISKRPRRNFRDSLILELERQAAEADRKAAEAVNHSRILH